MSLLNLRDQYIIPILHDEEMALGHLLSTSLDNDDEENKNACIKKQRYITELISFSQKINNALTSKIPIDVESFYKDAEKRLKITAPFHDRVVQTKEEIKTKLQVIKAKAKPTLKPTAKIRVKSKPSTSTSTSSFLSIDLKKAYIFKDRSWMEYPAINNINFTDNNGNLTINIPGLNNYKTDKDILSSHSSKNAVSANIDGITYAFKMSDDNMRDLNTQREKYNLPSLVPKSSPDQEKPRIKSIKSIKSIKNIKRPSVASDNDEIILDMTPSKTYILKDGKYQLDSSVNNIVLKKINSKITISIPQLSFDSTDINIIDKHPSSKNSITINTNKGIYAFRLTDEDFAMLFNNLEANPKNMADMDDIDDMIREIDNDEVTRLTLTKITNGDLLTIKLNKGDYIVHQTNTVSKGAAGLAKDLFKRYPDDNIYSNGTKREVGKAVVTDYLIHLMGQKRAGGANKTDDDASLRMVWFMQALEQVRVMIESKSLIVKNLYFPYYIGSGLAGGEWKDYHKAISLFEEAVRKIDKDIKIHIIRKIKIDDRAIGAVREFLKEHKYTDEDINTIFKLSEYNKDFDPRDILLNVNNDKLMLGDTYISDYVPYRENDPEKQLIFRKLNNHIGQRKLLLSEVYFLTSVLENYDSAATLLYAGAAGGHHLPYLASLFPNITFLLYDPQPFFKAVMELAKTNDKIKIFNSYFTDTEANQYKDKIDLFICDIRIAKDDDFEQQVKEDMEMQKRWTLIINPKIASMLKFRPPYYINEMPDLEYLDGDIVKQTWPPELSTETRLISKPPYGLKKYPIKRYESACYTHNILIRPWLIYNSIYLESVPGYNNSWDSRSEAFIWEKYREKRKEIAVEKHMNNVTMELRKNISVPGKLGGIIKKKGVEYLVDVLTNYTQNFK